MADNREIRALGDLRVERRQDDGGEESRRIVGYAAVFDTPTDIAGLFREQFAPGAFAMAIARDDIRALIDHDPTLILGRNRAGTLSLAEDAKGLHVDIDPPETQAARDLMVSIERGDVSGMSIGFIARRQEWDDTQEPPLRTIHEAELLDVSAVTFPAYPTTEVGLRSLESVRAARQPEAEAAPRSNRAALTAMRLRMLHRLREKQLAE